MKVSIRSSALAAVALAAGPVMAQSSVTIAGRVDVGPQYIDNGTVKLKKIDSGTYTASRLIIKGTEDLGGGLSALFYLESRFNADTGAQQVAAKFWNAGSYVGLSSKDFGTLTMGRQYVPIFYSFLFADDTGPLRLHGYSALQSIQRSNFARVRATASPIKATGTVDALSTDGSIYSIGITSAFEDNLVIYKTPSFSGLSAQIAAGAPEGYAGTTGKVLGGNIEYRTSLIYGSVAYNQKEGTVPQAGPETNQKLREALVSGLYTIVPEFKVWGNFHPWQLKDTGASLKGRDWMLGVSWWMPTGELWVNYARKTINYCPDCNSRGIGIGYHYFLSKRSELYASFAKVGNDANSANQLNGNAPGTFGQSVRGLAAGVAVTF